MTEIDYATRVELLLANYAAMIAHLNELERKMNRFQEFLDSWDN